MILPLVDVFNSPYEAWSTRNLTPEEMLEHYNRTKQMTTHVNDKLLARVNNALDAANYMARTGADNGLGNFINDTLDNNANLKSWRGFMPSITPVSLGNYQKRYPDCDFDAVNRDINNSANILSEGQVLFHGGLWPSPSGSNFTTSRPLSSTFCPQVALRNAEHKGKAYDSNRIDLFVLRSTNPKTNVFLYRRAGTNLGNENEVLFAAGANLIRRSETMINDNYSAFKYPNLKKKIPVYVLEVDIS